MVRRQIVLALAAALAASAAQADVPPPQDTPYAPGAVSISVDATNLSKIVTARTLVWAPVESAALPSGGEPTLKVTGVGTVKTSAIRGVAA